MARSALPPLPALRAFEAAARSGNFTQAAAQLGLTQAAVSYQIKVLEERVGHPLFHRQARGVELTPVGTALAKRASEAFDIIADAFSEAQGASRGTLEISVIPTFATSFLAQRLGEFQVQHPGLAVCLEVSETLVDFRTSTVDAAIRSGHGDWPDLISHKLVETRFTPMLSPALAESMGGISTPSDLLRLPMIAGSDPRWQTWFSAAGLQDTVQQHRPHQHLGPQILEATAAIAGQGVALLTPSMFRDALASGQLIRPFDLECHDGSAYWLVYPPAFRNAPKIKRFLAWLQQTLRDEQA